MSAPSGSWQLTQFRKPKVLCSCRREIIGNFLTCDRCRTVSLAARKKQQEQQEQKPPTKKNR